jgi:hypothetical protein
MKEIEERNAKRRARNKELRDKLGGKSKEPKSGRKPNDLKLKAAIRTEQIFPTNFPREMCVLSHTRPVWRVENNKAVIVAYEVWIHKPTKTYCKITGVIGRNGYGLEFIHAVAASGTNNEAERILRNPAQARNADRASKDAQRRTTKNDHR